MIRGLLVMAVCCACACACADGVRIDVGRITGIHTIPDSYNRPLVRVICEQATVVVYGPVYSYKDAQCYIETVDGRRWLVMLYIHAEGIDTRRWRIMG